MINFLDLMEINKPFADELKEACARVIDSGWYIHGEEVALFEQEFASYCGVDYCIGVANGLDALTLTIRAWKELGRLKEGDEIKLINNKKFPIKSIDEYSLTEDIKLYDICVGGNNTFIVYDMIVHNKKTGIEPPPPPKPNKGDVFNHYQILAI